MTHEQIFQQFAQQQQQTQPKEAFFYLHSEILKKIEVRGFNLLSIFELTFKRNLQGLILIPFKKQIELPNAPYSIILQVFLNTVANMNYSAVIID